MSKIITLKSSKVKESLYDDKDAVVVFLTKEYLEYVPQLLLPKDLQEAIDYAEEQDENMTDKGKITPLVIERPDGWMRLILVGLGERQAWNPMSLRQGAGSAIRELWKGKLKQVAVVAPLLMNPARAQFLKALGEGLLLGNYTFDKYKKNAGKKEKLTITIGSSIKAGAEILKTASTICDSICFARDLANEPGNVIWPEIMAEKAVQTGLDSGLEVEVLTEKEMQEKGMNAILAVGQGSIHAPRMITLKYNNGGNKPYTAFVGKGITFDSGGISLKPGDGMGEMKDDMSGAAAVLGAIRAIAALKLPVNIIAVLACAENMPGGRAQRPGDIVKAASGTTIEVVNTDAEGRMVLADAVWYACQKGAKQVIDIATLTGAVTIALGDHTSAIVCNDDDLTQELINAGKRCGEGWWPLPILPDCGEAIKSSVADLKNSAGRAGGVITGGMFIGSFVKEGLPWAHLDIGGTSTAKKTEGHIVEGCTAFGTATLIELIRGI